MDIYSYLKKDHRKVSDLMAQVLRARSPARRKEIFGQIHHELTLHAFAEEATLYAVLEEEPETEEKIEEAWEEHEEMKSYLNKLMRMSAESEKWMEMFGEFKHAVEHHVKEEEGRLFDKARELLDEEEEYLLAEAMERLKQQALKRAA